MNACIIWFRRDLRLQDNPALEAGLATGKPLIPLFIHAPDEEAPWEPGGASRWWLHHSLAALSRDLRECGSRLIIARGSSLETLQRIAGLTGATEATWNRLYDPATMARDRHIKTALNEAGVHCTSHNAALLCEPWQANNRQEQPFRVFTPFWRCIQVSMGPPAWPSPAPDHLPAPDRFPESLHLEELGLLPRSPWYRGMQQAWRPGETGAAAALRELVDDVAPDYARERDLPANKGTSRLSPHLHFGEIGPRQIRLALLQASGSLDGQPASDGTAAYLRELGWREFAHHLLYHFPHTTERPMDSRFQAFQWRDAPGELNAWQRGETGIPLVDAGMRELWETGWMHNRVRMVVASLLTKNLRQHWLHGARWFWDTLVDADLANNTLGWQWTAGCGADAAPYFRVFNPVRQGERFDPEGRYVRHWLPKLRRLPDRWIHQPWAAPAAVLAEAEVTLGREYPHPMVDLAESRKAALAEWNQLKTRAGA